MLLGLSITGGAGYGGTAGGGLALGYTRRNGYQFGLYGLLGFAPGTYTGKGGSVTLEATFSRNKNIKDYKGWGVQIGANALGFGFETTTPFSSASPAYTGSYSIIDIKSPSITFYSIPSYMWVLPLIGDGY